MVFCGAEICGLDGRVKEITETALGYLLMSHPNAEIVETDEGRIVRVAMYDFRTDGAWIEERKIVPDPHKTSQGILPVYNVRTGPKFNPAGDAKVSPLGHLFRIIGYTPPTKDDAE